MIPRQRVASAHIPGGGEMTLYRRGDDHMILVDREELMSTRMGGSEEALATMTAERLGRRPAQRWLIGGYGMGFTLRAALGVLPADARITVAELMPEIVDWARGPMAALTGASLDDPRVTVRIGDVADSIAQGPWDAILLDVDNGPDGLVRADNDRLYSAAGLVGARGALARGGILAIWSAAPDPAFAKRLAAARFRVEEQGVRARANGKGPRHVIWFATPA
ncbi:spermidine synthase [Sphingomonas sabuli]|uniref:Spermidine synthase n=1 Tax=Sphingomonas sabuli TaxID=2764186 RepID=A0A7G9L206_9SPHN|nr:spermidine synthase [Sphingomonas sabuli]QNM82655.1 spermidine synthase [Sphingomonas sabuli]